MATFTKWVQKYLPRLSVAAIRGWCLKYVDDAGNALTRRPSAKAAYDAEKKAKRIRTYRPPKGVWVVGFLGFTTGPYTHLGHVFLMKYNGNGKYDIRDSEVAAGARSRYTSIDSVKAWFGAYKPVYLGWSPNCDGRQYARSYKVVQYVVNVFAARFRSAPSLKAKILAVKPRGFVFNVVGSVRGAKVDGSTIWRKTERGRYVHSSIVKKK